MTLWEVSLKEYKRSKEEKFVLEVSRKENIRSKDAKSAFFSLRAWVVHLAPLREDTMESFSQIIRKEQRRKIGVLRC